MSSIPDLQLLHGGRVQSGSDEHRLSATVDRPEPGDGNQAAQRDVGAQLPGHH